MSLLGKLAEPNKTYKMAEIIIFRKSLEFTRAYHWLMEWFQIWFHDRLDLISSHLSLSQVRLLYKYDFLQVRFFHKNGAMNRALSDVVLKVKNPSRLLP